MDRRIAQVVSEGDPYQRGLQLGEQAPLQVAHTVRTYFAMFRARSGMRREQALGHAERFIPVIRQQAPALFEEMQGIAAATSHDLREIVAVNARTELLYGVTAATECTAVGTSARGSADGHVRLGQNWDWHPSVAGALVLWTLKRPEGLDVVTLVEAGIVGKIGVNSAGLAMAINLLRSDWDNQGPALPMHVILRQVLDTATDVAAAVRVISETGRCTSCNHLIVDRTGTMADVEATPGGTARHDAVSGCLTHTNHCLDAGLALCDSGVRESTDTLLRLARVEALVAPQPLTENAFRAALADHADAPSSVCRHVDHGKPDSERAETVASVIFDLTAGTIDLADGPPCMSRYQRTQLSTHFGAVPATL